MLLLHVECFQLSLELFNIVHDLSNLLQYGIPDGRPRHREAAHVQTVRFSRCDFVLHVCVTVPLLGLNQLRIREKMLEFGNLFSGSISNSVPNSIFFLILKVAVDFNFNQNSISNSFKFPLQFP